MGASLISRSLANLRSRGYVADVCERSNRFIKHDLHGFGDIHAFDHDRVLIVQVTDSDHAAEHRLKIEGNVYAASWLEASGRSLLLHIWSRRKLVRKGVRWEWRLREELLSIQPKAWLAMGDDLEEVKSA